MEKVVLYFNRSVGELPISIECAQWLVKRGFRDTDGLMHSWKYVIGVVPPQFLAEMYTVTKQLQNEVKLDDYLNNITK